MALWPNFIGPSYTTRSQLIDDEETINLYSESTESQGNAKKTTFYGTPGLILLGTVADTVCRGMFSQDGRSFAAIGASLYEMTFSGSGSTLTVSTVNRGAITNDGLPVFFAINGQGGNQLAVSAGGNLYILNLVSNALTGPITVPLTNAASTVVFLNSYFLLAEQNSLRVWFSEFEDGTIWNALDFFARSNTSDNVVGMAVLHDQIRVFGSKSNELYYNAGEADNPFLPYQGSLMEDGAVSRFAIQTVGETIVWLAKNRWDVQRIIQVGVGEAKVISTPPVNFALSAYTKVTDAELQIYEQEEHQYGIVTFPAADVTWGFDVREGQWHKRSSRLVGDSLDPPQPIHKWRVRGICAPGNQAIICGDWLNGNIYALDLDTFTENCVLMPRLRRAPYPSAENQRLFVSQIELGTQPGVALASGVGSAANVTLRMSRNGGQTYPVKITISSGAQNDYLARTIWRRLGMFRADRMVAEVSTTDPVRIVWGPGLWLRTTNGQGSM